MFRIASGTEFRLADVEGTFVRLTGAFSNPQPVQRPHPPMLIGGRASATLRVVAEHADLWNIPGGDIADCIAHSAVLDRPLGRRGARRAW